MLLVDIDKADLITVSTNAKDALCPISIYLEINRCIMGSYRSSLYTELFIKGRYFHCTNIHTQRNTHKRTRKEHKEIGLESRIRTWFRYYLWCDLTWTRPWINITSMYFFHPKHEKHDHLINRLAGWHWLVVKIKIKTWN